MKMEDVVLQARRVEYQGQVALFVGNVGLNTLVQDHLFNLIHIIYNHIFYIFFFNFFHLNVIYFLIVLYA